MSLLLLPLLLKPVPGERWLYEVRFGFLKAGELILEVRPDTSVGEDSAWCFRLIASTTGGFRRLFPLDDTLISYVSKRTFHTLLSRKRFREKNYRVRRSAWYLHDLKLAIYSDGDTVAMPPGSLDPLALIFLLRFQQLQPGDTLRLSYHADKRSGRVLLQVEQAGPLFRIRVQGMKGGLIRGSQGFSLWIHPETGVPEIIEIRLSFGTLRGVLQKDAMGGTRTRTGNPTRS